MGISLVRMGWMDEAESSSHEPVKGGEKKFRPHVRRELVRFPRIGKGVVIVSDSSANQKREIGSLISRALDHARRTEAQSIALELSLDDHLPSIENAYSFLFGLPTRRNW